MRRLIIITLYLVIAVSSTALQAERIKDISSIAGVRSNQLVGYGIVVGLAGSGDGGAGSRYSLCSPWCLVWYCC